MAGILSSALRKKQGKVRASFLCLLLFFFFKVPWTQNNTYANVTYFGVACSVTLQVTGQNTWLGDSSTLPWFIDGAFWYCIEFSLSTETTGWELGASVVSSPFYRSKQEP
jgi:hypothetical protein